MGLGDIYNNVPDSFSGQANRQLGQAFQGLPEVERQYHQNRHSAQQNVDQAYNSPARQATSTEQGIGSYIQTLFAGRPPEDVERFKQEMVRPGLNGGGGFVAEAQPQQGMTAPYSGPMARPPEQMGGMTNMGAPSRPPPNFAVSMPESGQADRDRFAATMRDQSMPQSGGMQRPPQEPGMMSGGPQFQSSTPQKLNRPASPMTHGDVNKLMDMAPFAAQQSRERVAANKGGLTFEERIKLQNNKGSQDRITETTKQGGRLELEDIRGTRQKLMKLAELALEQRQLDETTSRHIDQFNIELAKLENMTKYQDRLLTLKAGSQRDEMLNNGRQLVASLRNSQSGLISSGFAGTPLGQEFIRVTEEPIAKWEAILDQYADGTRHPAGAGGGADMTGQSSSFSYKQPGAFPSMAPRKGQPQAGRPQQGGQRPNGPFRFRFKVATEHGPAGSTGHSDDPSDFDPNTMELVQ